MFWIISAGMLLLASLFVLLPLWWRERARVEVAERNGAQERDSANLAIYQERLGEMEQDLAAGIFDRQQFDALKLELERNLLADVSDDPDSDTGKIPAQHKAASWLTPVKLIPLFLVLCLPAVSYLFYEQWGFRSELVLRDLQQRTQSAATNPELALEVIYELTDYIDQHPDNGWAWYFLSQNLRVLGQMPEVSIALERASSMIDQPQDKAFLLGSYALNEFILAGQQVNDKVRDIISQAQRLDPNQIFTLQILALDAERTGDTQSAITYWQRVLQVAPSSEEAQFLRDHINELQATVIASANEAEAGTGPVIDVEVTLAAELNLPPETRVFVSALEYNGRGQPLAAKALTVAELPTTVSLDNAAAVGPFNLSSADMVVVVATVSLSGSATIQAGDYRVQSQPFQHANSHAVIQLEIKEQLPEQ